MKQAKKRKRISTKAWDILKRKDKSRKLVAEWTVEMAEDFMTYHGLDLENEIAEILKKQIDEEILNSIYETNKETKT